MHASFSADYLKNGKVVIVLELMEGGDAFDYICDNGKLTEEKTRKWFRSLLKGLEYLHANLIVHRDLKLENVLIDANDKAKITGMPCQHIPPISALFRAFLIAEINLLTFVQISVSLEL